MIPGQLVRIISGSFTGRIAKFLRYDDTFSNDKILALIEINHDIRGVIEFVIFTKRLEPLCVMERIYGDYTT